MPRLPPQVTGPGQLLALDTVRASSSHCAVMPCTLSRCPIRTWKVKGLRAERLSAGGCHHATRRADTGARSPAGPGPGPGSARRRGLAFRRPLPALPARMLDDRVRAGEHQGGVTVVESHQVRRLPARSADLDDLARPL